MSSGGSSSSNGGEGSGKPAPGIQSLVKSVQFAWFVGHVLALVGAVFYTLFSFKIFRAPSFPKFWYKEAYVAIIFTFSIILNKTYRNKAINAPDVLRDDNVHYLLAALLWLFSKPYFGTLPPFIVFSLFHVLTYMRSFLLPALGHGAQSPISVNIGSFVSNYNDRFMMLAANAEFFLFLRLFVFFITLRKGSLIPFIVYFVFIKLRYDSSMFTRSVLKTYEVRIDGLVGHPSCPHAIKNAWTSFKGLLSTYLGTPIIQAAPQKTQ